MAVGGHSETSATALSALAKVVDSVGAPGFCGALADAAATVLDYDNLIILAYAGADTPCELYRRSVSPVCYAEVDTKYLTSHYVFDPFYAAHLNRAPRGLHRLADVQPDKFRSSTYFLEYYSATTLLDEIALFAYTKTGWTITACFGRDHVSGKPFDKRQLTSFGRLADVFSALMERHWAGFQPDAKPEGLETGEVFDALAERLRHRGVSLTRRQIEVALLILQGHSSRSMAMLLGVSWQTVKVFRRQLYARCGISSQAELFALLSPLLSNRGAAASQSIGS